MSGATLDEMLAPTAHHSIATPSQRAHVRSLLAGQPDAEVLVAMLGLDLPDPKPVQPKERPQHYHSATLPRARRVGGMA